jgi:hypothetical protein
MSKISLLLKKRRGDVSLLTVASYDDVPTEDPVRSQLVKKYRKARKAAADRKAYDAEH